MTRRESRWIVSWTFDVVGRGEKLAKPRQNERKLRRLPRSDGNIRMSTSRDRKPLMRPLQKIAEG